MSKKNPAKESSTIKRLRNRLEKHLIIQENQMSKEALAEMTGIIQKALERKVKSQVNLKKKGFTVFKAKGEMAKDAKSTERLRLLVKRDYFHQ